MSVKMTSTVLAGIFVMLALTSAVSAEHKVVCGSGTGDAAREKDAKILVDILRVLTPELIPSDDETCRPVIRGPATCFEIFSRDSATIWMCTNILQNHLPCNKAGELLNEVLAQCVTDGENGQKFIEGHVEVKEQNFVGPITYYISARVQQVPALAASA